MTAESLAKPLLALPRPGGRAGQRALQALLHRRSVLAALKALHAEMGDVFQVSLPGFSPVFLVGPEANRFVAVTGRADLRWRAEGDPVTKLLRQGVLVTDGDQHAELRGRMQPALHRRMLGGYLESMARCTGRVTAAWTDGGRVDMLVEMRKVALLILMDALFRVDLGSDLHNIWPAVLRTLAYISPGAWLIWPGVPRPGYRGALQQMDDTLYQIITRRRALPGAGDDLLGLLVNDPGLDDGLIRDQLLTMLIAGHDTSTALLAWALYLLGSHPQALAAARAEVDAVLGGSRETPGLEQVGRLEYLERVIQETLRLYPPVHLGSRIAAQDLEFQGYRIPAGRRVVYSIYLTHRMAAYWPDPERFEPDRFLPEQARQRPHYTYLPFGGGPRNCLGLAFAQVEVKVVLAHLLQNFDLTLGGPPVHAHMGATLEPRPGVWMTVRKRSEA